jgi:hypothetical protein
MQAGKGVESVGKAEIEHAGKKEATRAASIEGSTRKHSQTRLRAANYYT